MTRSNYWRRLQGRSGTLILYLLFPYPSLLTKTLCLFQEEHLYTLFPFHSMRRNRSAVFSVSYYINSFFTIFVVINRLQREKTYRRPPIELKYPAECRFE